MPKHVAATTTSTSTSIVHFVHVWVLSSSSAFSMRPQLIRIERPTVNMINYSRCSSATQQNISSCISYVCVQCIQKYPNSRIKLLSSIHIHSTKTNKRRTNTKKNVRKWSRHMLNIDKGVPTCWIELNLSTYVFQYSWVSVLSA